MCGEHTTLKVKAISYKGSSPHVRGALPFAVGADVDVGIIPACAGSTRSLTFQSMSSRDHPRMCGEHAQGFDTGCLTLGSSPHVRGALLAWRLDAVARGIIPACAGSTAGPIGRWSRRWDHPRMCGEHWSDY